MPRVGPLGLALADGSSSSALLNNARNRARFSEVRSKRDGLLVSAALERLCDEGLGD